MPSAIWKMTAVGSQGVYRAGRAPTPCSGPSQFEHDFKRKVYILNDLEQTRAHILYNESLAFFFSYRFQANTFNTQLRLCNYRHDTV